MSASDHPCVDCQNLRRLFVFYVLLTGFDRPGRAINALQSTWSDIDQMLRADGRSIDERNRVIAAIEQAESELLTILEG